MAHSHRQRPEHARARDVGLAFHRPRRTTTLVAAAGMLAASATIAVAGTPPPGPANIEIFNNRSMVALEGYTDQAGKVATVQVLRGGDVIGRGTGTVAENGFLEFNHPGGECWTDVTPNIGPGDEVRVSFEGAAFTDSAFTSTARVTEVVGSGFVAADPPRTAADPPNRVNGEGTVEIRGRMDPRDPWFSTDRFVIETVNPDNRDDKTPPGEDHGLVDDRAMGITLVPDREHPNGDPGRWDASATYDPATGEIVGTYTLYTQVDYERTLEGDHVFAAWMAGEGQGLTQFEFEETPGPGMGGCPPSPSGSDPVPPTTATLSSPSGSTSVEVSWEPPAQPADAPAITRYRVAAVGGTHAEQEVAQRTASTTVSLDGLEAGSSYEILIDAYNGQWTHEPMSVGTIVVGSGTGTPPPPPPPPPGDGEDPPAEVTEAPSEPTGLAATSESLDSASVTWSPPPSEEQVTGYTVSAADTDPETADVTVQAAGTDTSATLSGLAPGTRYTVSLTATNAVGTSDAATTTVTTQRPVAPLDEGFHVTRTIAGDTTIHAEWTAAEPGNASSPVTGYRIRAKGPDGDTVTADVGPTVLQGEVTGLVNGTAYALEVVALGGGGETRATAASGVSMTVTPTPSATFARVEYKPRSTTEFEWRIRGSASPSLVGQTIATRTSAGDAICSATVVEDGSFGCEVRNRTRAPRDAAVIGTATSGFRFEGSITRVR